MAVLALGLAGWRFVSYLQSPPSAPGGKPVTVVIPVGSGVRSIARRLADAGVIRSQLMFRWEVRSLGAGSQLKAGEYRFPAGEPLDQVVRRLMKGMEPYRQVVIPEGWTVRQIAELLAREKLCPEAEFVRAASVSPADYSLPVTTRRPTLEGYLMPDTYRLPLRCSGARVVRVMTDNWKRRVWGPLESELRKGPGPDQRMIIAAMIEREAQHPRERPLIASVIRNRLQRGMKLQIDATVLYALGRHKDRVLFRDLEVDHPYNTYRIPGLPPGPICNPGLASIQAALRPAETKFLYYVARSDGSHVFTTNAAEHAVAVAQSRADRRPRP